MPELPDYLGYLFGLVLIWLVYTGYTSVVQVFTDTKSSVSQITKKAKEQLEVGASKLPDKEELAKKLAELEVPSLSVTGSDEAAALAEEGEAIEEKGFVGRTFDFLNRGIDTWSARAGNKLQEIINGAPAEKPQPRRARDLDTNPPPTGRDDSLDYF